MKVKLFRTSKFLIINQCYLFFKDNVGVLVDPAWDYKLIDNFLIDNQVSLKGILLTHSHLDHTNLANEFAENKNVPVYMAEEEMKFSGFNCLNLKSVKHLQEITIEGFKIVSILTPGHTPGSSCYLVENNLFTGDTIFIEGVGACSTLGGDADKMYDSVHLLKRILYGNTIFWPGHSFGEAPGKSLNFLLKNNIYFKIKNKTHFINFRMRKNQPNLFTFK